MCPICQANHRVSTAADTKVLFQVGSYVSCQCKSLACGAYFAVNVDPQGTKVSTIPFPRTKHEPAVTHALGAS